MMAKNRQYVPKMGRHKASGQGVVRLNGHDYYLGPYGLSDTQQAYDDLIAKWLANNREPINEEPEHVCLESLVLAYTVHCEAYYVKNGRQTDELACVRSALRDLLTVFDQVPIAEFGPLKLEMLQNHLISRGLARGYINNQISRIRRMFKWGVSREIVPPSVFQALVTLPGLRKGKTAARETSPIMPVSDEDFETVVAELDEVTAAMVRIQRLTGMRPGEVRMMRPCDIDRTRDVWRYVPGSHKTEHRGRERVILIGPKAQSILARFLLRPAESYCFVREDGKPLERWNYGSRIANACKRAWPAPKDATPEQKREWHKRHRWSPNQLRHAVATQIRQEFGLEATQAVLGHAKADVTQIYAERDLGTAEEVMRRMG